MNTDQDLISNAKSLVEKININAKFIPHDQSGKSTDNAVSALGVSADTIIKTLILYDSKKLLYIGVIILGTDTLDTKKITILSDSKKLSFANEFQIRELTGFKIGGVPPMAVMFCSKAFIDLNVISKDRVIGAGGSEFCGLEFSPKEFITKLSIVVDNVIKTK